MHNSLTDIIYQARRMAHGVRCKFGMYFTRGTYHRNISCYQSGHSVMARSVLPCADIKYIRQYVTRAHNHPHYGEYILSGHCVIPESVDDSVNVPPGQ